ncbi:hypothetical protein [Azospirillum humicireducens]|nr:hypothetical protein [Azospirillum humicireducens]
MPTALLVSCAIYRYGTARLPAALKAAGFRVFAVCPQNSLLEFSDNIDGRHSFPAGISPDDLTVIAARAAAQVRADIVIACEETAVRVLNSADRLMEKVPADSADARCLRMVGAWYGGRCWEALRSQCVEQAAAAGIRTPRQIVVDPGRTGIADLAELGTPLLLKCDYSSAGRGVLLARCPREALELAAQGTAGRQETDVEMPADGRIVAQDFIRGVAASVSFSALRGRMLEGFAFTTLHHQPEPFGPASVIEVGDHPALMDMARYMVELTGYSGFGGIDAILPEDGSPPVFLEFNARPTQTGHLGGLVGADLCRAMACALEDRPYDGGGGRSAAMPIALFPAEWVRDPHSRHLMTAHHDVPWSERRMIAAILSITPQLHPA